jgi:hypothetical protein
MPPVGRPLLKNTQAIPLVAHKELILVAAEMFKFGDVVGTGASIGRTAIGLSAAASISLD